MRREDAEGPVGIALIEPDDVVVAVMRAVAERGALRLADMLAAIGQLSPAELLKIRAPIVWNAGKSLMVGADAFTSADRLDEFNNGISTIMRGHFGESQSAVLRVERQIAETVADDSPVAPADRAVLQRYLFSGATWLTPEAGRFLAQKNPRRPSALRLGVIQDSHEELIYDRNESLITVAPPGSGKVSRRRQPVVSAPHDDGVIAHAGLL